MRRRLRLILLVTGWLTLIVLVLLAAFGDARGTRHSLTMAGISTALVLLLGPGLRPPEGTAAARSAVTRRTGQTLIILAWLARAVTAGLVTYQVTSRFDQPPGFDRRVAAFAAASQGLLLMLRLGRRLAGFPTDARAGRGITAVLRWAVNAGIAVVLAGYAAVLPQLVSNPSGVLDSLTRDSGWAPIRLYRFLADLVTPWVAVPAMIVVCALALLLVSVALGLLLPGLALLLGRDNPISQWLSENAPVWYERTDTEVTFVSRFVAEVDYHNSAETQRLHAKFLGFSVNRDDGFGLYERQPLWRFDLEPRSAHHRSGQPVDEAPLLDHVVAELVDRVPDGWHSLRLEYRAVLGHQETEVMVDPPKESAGVTADGSEPEALPLPDFGGNDALWRLRKARYDPVHGAPYAMTLFVDRDQLAPMFLDEDGIPAEPAWHRRPTRQQYRADLRRFPVARRHRPFWLRARLSRFG
ncbi:hypothetical protein ACFQ0D_07530 [Micromonospora zhanjiangensis]